MKFYELGILYKEYLKIFVKREKIELQNINLIKTIFLDLEKSLHIFYALTQTDKKSFIFIRGLVTLKIWEGRGYRGSSDEKMRRLWLGLEIIVPLGHLDRFKNHNEFVFNF